MNKTIKILLLLCIITIPITLYSNENTDGVNITICNIYNQKMVYFLYWIDHPYRNIHQPIDMAGGELEPFRKHILERKYSSGSYAILWNYNRGESDKIIKFKIEDDIKKIIITNNEIIKKK